MTLDSESNRIVQRALIPPPKPSHLLSLKCMSGPSLSDSERTPSLIGVRHRHCRHHHKFSRIPPTNKHTHRTVPGTKSKIINLAACLKWAHTLKYAALTVLLVLTTFAGFYCTLPEPIVQCSQVGWIAERRLIGFFFVFAIFANHTDPKIFTK